LSLTSKCCHTASPGWRSEAASRMHYITDREARRNNCFTALFFESNPMRTLLDFAAFLRFQHLLGHPVEFLQHDSLAAHSSHEGENQRTLLTLVERGNSLSIERPATAHTAESHVGFNDADHLE